MTRPRTVLTRRNFLLHAGLASAASLVSRRPLHAASDLRSGPLALTLKERAVGADPRWLVDPSHTLAAAGFRQGDRLQLALANALDMPVAVGLIGLDGAQAWQPALGRAPLEAGGALEIDLPLTQAGTVLLDTRLLGDGLAKPLPVVGFAVAETAPPRVDQDHILLIEDQRLQPSGTSIGPGRETASAETVYLVNGEPSFDLTMRPNERLRLRLINGCQRNAIALQFAGHDVRIIAVDSRSAEPFLARDRRLVLAPGARVDALLDATAAAGSSSTVQLLDGGAPRPIGRLTYGASAPVRPQPLPPANALPDTPPQLELARAVRSDISLDPSAVFGGAGWLTPKNLVHFKGPPSFRVKRGRTVLLTLVNPTATPATLHLHGHHFRWLDRLDDGWKPFLPDTIIIDAKQTERIAFLAQFPGEWLIEAAAMEWSAPKRVRWFAVD